MIKLTLIKLYKYILILPIKMYQLLISPFIGASCRFSPTCSDYAIEAIDRFGIIKGTLLSIRRILRCNPLGSSGYDPIPD